MQLRKIRKNMEVKTLESTENTVKHKPVNILKMQLLKIVNDQHGYKWIEGLKLQNSGYKNKLD